MTAAAPSFVWRFQTERGNARYQGDRRFARNRQHVGLAGCQEPFRLRPSGRPPSNHRLNLDRIFWTARAGVPWRDLRKAFGKWSPVYRQFRRWTLVGNCDVILEALNDSGRGQDSVQMIDGTIVSSHQHAAGQKSVAASDASAAREGLGRSSGGNSTNIHLRT
jgi:transposase